MRRAMHLYTSVHSTRGALHASMGRSHALSAFANAYACAACADHPRLSLRRYAIGIFRVLLFLVQSTLQFIVQFRSSSSSLNRPWLP